MLEHVWKLSKKIKHKFLYWVKLVLCKLKKVKVPHRMEHTLVVFIVGVYL